MFVLITLIVVAMLVTMGVSWNGWCRCGQGPTSPCVTAFAGIFSGSSHTSDSKIGTPVATLPDAWRYRVSAGTGRPGVSIL